MLFINYNRKLKMQKNTTTYNIHLLPQPSVIEGSLMCAYRNDESFDKYNDKNYSVLII